LRIVAQDPRGAALLSPRWHKCAAWLPAAAVFERAEHHTLTLTLLALFPVAFAGTVAWFLNAEATVLLAVTTAGLHPVAVGLVAAAGQGLGHVVLWSGGGRLRRMWPWFDRQCARVQVRWGPRLASGTVPLMAVSGVIGIPPASATALLAPGLGLRRELVIPILFVGRAIRFTIMGLLFTEL
jgi:membrane protein YqaA with SNARE-associated domain